jgi:hypothetical protein
MVDDLGRQVWLLTPSESLCFHVFLSLIKAVPLKNNLSFIYKKSRNYFHFLDKLEMIFLDQLEMIHSMVELGRSPIRYQE